jgi:hypothetical protein
MVCGKSSILSRQSKSDPGRRRGFCLLASVLTLVLTLASWLFAKGSPVLLRMRRRSESPDPFSCFFLYSKATNCKKEQHGSESSCSLTFCNRFPTVEPRGRKSAGSRPLTLPASETGAASGRISPWPIFLKPHPALSVIDGI